MASPGISFLGWLGRFAKLPGLGEFASRFGDIGAFAPEIVRYRAAQVGVGDVMRGVRGLRQVAARDLVLTLRAGLPPLKASLDRKVEGMREANLEMQDGVMLDRAPVAAEQGIRADEIDSAGDPAAIAPG